MPPQTFSGAVVRVRGDKRLLKAIAKLRDPELKQVNTRALKRAGEAIRDRARNSYLSGDPLRRITGELYHSVTLTSERPDEFVKVGSPLPQAMPLHFGWPAHNMKARPWLFPALEDEFPRLPDIWVDEMDRSVRAVK